MVDLPYGAPADFDWVVRLAEWEKIDEGVELKLGTVRGRKIRLVIRSVSPRVWRWTFLKIDPNEDETTPCVVRRPQPLPSPNIRETERGLRIEYPGLILEVDREPWSFRFLDRRGRTVISDNPKDVDGLGRPFVWPLGLAYTKTGPLVSASFHLAPDEHLYGLGEKFTRADKVHQKIVGWNRDALGSTSERSHKNVPFLLSSRGYGLFIDSGARLTWELGTESCQSYTVKLEDAALDAYFIYGPTPRAVLRRYADLTGHAPVPPKWSFGLWLSSGGTYRTQAEIERLIDGIGRNRLPADVIHIDPWWMRWRRYCDFRWDREAFPDPERLIRKIHAAGLSLCLWEHPYISVESDLCKKGRARGYFVRRPDGDVYVIDYGLSLAPRPDGIVRRATAKSSWNARVAVIDFTNPRAVSWYKDLHRPLLRMGVDVFKTDFGEDIPADAVFADGRTGATMHNLYPLLYNRAVFEVTQEEKGYGLVWSRAGTAGSQRYPVCWSGDPAADWESLAATIRGGLSAAFSGIPFWSHDIGGYRGMPSPELYIRWAQFGLLSSHSRMHGDSPREPWHFGEPALRIVRKFARLRYRFFPYLYSLAHEANRTGMPVIRPLGLMFPDDPNAWTKDLEFMLGPWLLVAPIYRESGERWVYLPTARAKSGRAAAADIWIDYWRGQRYPGGHNLFVKAPLGRIPLFVRAGAIIPTMKPAERIPSCRIDPLIVEIWPGAESSFTFFEDEGATKFSLAWKNALPELETTGARSPKEITVRPALQNRRGRAKYVCDAMLFDAKFPWLQNPDVKTHACPDAANPVVFEIAKIRES